MSKSNSWPQRLGVAHQVEPVPGPAFAVVRRGEQPIDDLLVGAGRFVGQKGIDLGRRRRQADQVERHAAQQRALVGRRRRRQAGRFEPRQNESIDRRLDPSRVADCGGSTAASG